MRIIEPLPGTLPMPVHHIVGDWPMSSLGDNVFDLSGRGNNGAINGPAWAEGSFGPALDFAANQNVNFGDVLDELFTTGYTVSIWLNLVANWEAPIRSILNKSMNTSAAGGFLIAQTGTSLVANRISVFHWDGAAPSPYFLTNATMPINQYVHLAVTWDGTTAIDSIGIYFNAIRQAGAWASRGTLPIANNLNLRLGPVTGQIRNGIGRYDDLQIYNNNQNSSGVARLYRESFYRFPENRVFAVA